MKLIHYFRYGFFWFTPELTVLVANWLIELMKLIVTTKWKMNLKKFSKFDKWASSIWLTSVNNYWSTFLVQLIIIFFLVSLIYFQISKVIWFCFDLISTSKVSLISYVWNYITFYSNKKHRWDIIYRERELYFHIYRACPGKMIWS